MLGLCAEAGLVDVGVIAVDGSKFAAAASDSAIRTYEQLATEILEEAGRIDAAEDEAHGDARGDELPQHLNGREGRRAWLREAKGRLDAERAEREESIPREREERLDLCRQRLVEDWQTERRANRDYEAYRARGVMKDGRPFGRPPNPHTPPAEPEGKINTTDPDAKRMKFGRNFIPLPEEVTERLLMADAKAGDCGVVGDLIGADHSKGDVLAAAALDSPR